MRYLKLWESFEESNIQSLTSLDFSNWCDEHEFADFNKKDALIAFEIFDNLDEKIFGVWHQEFPFSKNRDAWFQLTNPKPNEPKLKKIDWFKGNDLIYLSAMSSYFFESSKFYSILVRNNQNYNEIGILKFQDEWYAVHVYSSRYGELCYLCDSIEGLREMIPIVEDLYSKEWETEE